ncbi:MAG: ABC transporter substrate-binding protein [Chloroflexota bacterium]
MTHARRHPATLAGLTVVAALAAAAIAAPTLAQSPAADGNYTVHFGFPSGNREQPAGSAADVWAIKQGYFDEAFKDAGITLDNAPFLGAGPAINEALIGNSLDVAIYADTAGVLGKTAGADTSLVAIDQPFTPAWLVVKSDSPITSVADLKGKTVGTIKATFPHRVLLSALAANGLTQDDINFVNLSLPDSEVALDAGQVDAIVTLGINAERLFTKGTVKPIFATADVPETAGISVIVAQNAFLDAHPGFFPAYLAARAKAVEWANANRDEALQILAESDQATPEEEAALYPTFDFTPAITPEILARIAATDQFLVDQGLAPAPLDLQSWVSNAAGQAPQP